MRRQRVSPGSEALSLFIGLGNAASRRIGRCTQCRHNSSSMSYQHSADFTNTYSSPTYYTTGGQILPKRLMAQYLPKHYLIYLSASPCPTRPPHLPHPLDNRIQIPHPNLQIPQHLLPYRYHIPELRLPRLPTRPPWPQQNRHILHQRENGSKNPHQRPSSRCLPRQRKRRLSHFRRCIQKRCHR